MLVLSRKESQRIRLGDSIVITVVRVTGDKVRIGIEAPRDMVILRDELEPLKLEATTRLPELDVPELAMEPETMAVQTAENLYETASMG